MFGFELVLGFATVCRIVSCGARDMDRDSGGGTGSELVLDADLCFTEENCHGEAGLGDAWGGSGASNGLLSP